VTVKKKNAKIPSPLSGLQIVGTPIGNLEDITLRALRILREADLIAAEDTRRTRKLLTHYDIHTPLVSYHEHNQHRMTPKLVAKLKNGEVVALVSDAGMPGISDPGHDLIALAIEEEIPLSIVPGPSSIISALVLSGLPTRSFHFEGFLPRKKGERSRRLRELLESKSTSVIFESPNRLTALLGMIAQLAPERRIVVARELTKKFEEVIRADASKAADHFAEKTPRGEFVVVIEGAAKSAKIAPLPTPVDAANLMKALMRDEGLTKKDAMRKATQLLNISRREVYRLLLEQESSEQ
jgi:16S rRNA (cytidine1402-2'-O)-methyltransferase